MKIALIGDISFHGKYSYENAGVYNYFSEVAYKLKEYDYVVGNLESPLTNSYSKLFGKSAHLKSHPRNSEILKYLNIDAVNLSNNHMWDYKKIGFEDTKKILKENGIEFFGVDEKILKVERGNNKVAFSGYCCYSTNGSGLNNSKNKAGINVLDPNKVEKQFLENDGDGYLNIGSFHIGEEHIHYPNLDHINMAHIMASKVPYIFYGHHPHVIQGIEQLNNSLLAYSLGNFCFDDVYTEKSKEPLIKQQKENKESYILEINLNNNKIIDYKVIPLIAEENKITLLSDAVMEEMEEYSSYLSLDREMYNSTRSSKLAKYLESRKEKRDFEWYIKRLNLNSVGIILRAKRNGYMYKKYVKNYISSKSD